MMFIAITPTPIWILLLLGTWASLAYLALLRLRIRHPAMNGLLLTMALQAVSGMMVVAATSLDAIGRIACLGGQLGVLAVLILALAQLAVLAYLHERWPRRADGARDNFRTWISVWAVFGLIAYLAHLRSVALCTV
ncbi:MAG: hypothetical protein AAF270_14680 [Pseudomonadota bacterium]